MPDVYKNYLNKIVLISRVNGRNETGRLVAIHDDFFELQNAGGMRSLVRKDQAAVIAEVPGR